MRFLSRRTLPPLAGLLALPLFALAPGVARAATFTVTKTADTNDGACDADCSLREAITAANSSAGADAIAFAIPVAQADANGAFTITTASALPAIAQQLTIDGYTQAGATPNTLPLAGGTNAVLKIVLSGGGINNNPIGLSFVAGADNSVVRGLAINNFAGAVTASPNSGGNPGQGAAIGINGANGVAVEGCFLGTSVAGTGTQPVGGAVVVGSASGVAVANAGGVVIGGASAAARNLISNNAINGVNISNVAVGATPNSVLNNLIGTTAAGNVALGNGLGTGEAGLSNAVVPVASGVFVANASGTVIGDSGAGNVIAGNGGIGVAIRQDTGTTIPTVGNQVLGNLIGVGGDGTTALGNNGDGVEISSAEGTIIGGAGAGAGNVLANNTGSGVAITGTLIVAGGGVDNSRVIGNTIHDNTMYGVLITGGVGHTVSQNSIYDNTLTGIDLAGDGVTANDAGDADTGANNLQNYPVLTTAATTGTTTTLSGTLDSPAGSYKIEFFANIAADGSGNGEGRTFLGAVSTAGGGAAFSAPITVPAGQFFLCATATNTATGDTSEFSADLTFNQPPVNGVPASASTSEDTALTFSAAGSNAITVSDPDAGNGAVTVALSVTKGVLSLSQTTGLTFTAGDGTADATLTFSGTLANINAALNGLRFDPTPNANGAATLTITSNDGGATGQSGPQQDLDSVPITITPVNDAPVAVNDSASTPEDTSVLINVLANDTDIDGPALTVTSVRPGPGTNGTLAIENNQVRFTPSLNFNGAASFGYTISDGSLSSSATVTVQVLAANDAPVATAQSVATNEDTPLAITLGASDVDSTSLSFEIVSGPRNGTLSGSGASRTYTPGANFNGSDSFTYRVSDGALNSTTEVIAISVRPVNDAPVAVDDLANAAFGTPISVQVLANDTDIDGDALSVSALDGAGTRGALSISADRKSVVFTPEAGFSGATSFGYTASDGTLTSSARVAVQVAPSTTPPNRAPVAVADLYRARGPLQVLAAAGVLRNDSDADGNTLRARLNSVPAHGRLSFKTDGSFVYTPAVSYSGPDSFTYAATDGTLESAIVKVTLAVTPLPDVTPPVLTLSGGSLRVVRQLVPVQGSAADVYALPGRGIIASSGLKSVVARLQRFGGDYWNGRSYQKAPFDLPTRRSGRSFFSVPLSSMPPLSQAPGGRYQWTAIATDNAGNKSQAVQFMLVDATAPSLVISTPAAGSDGVARVTRLESISGRVSEASRIEVALRNAGGAYFNGRAFVPTQTFLPATVSASTWALRLPTSLALSPGRYSIDVRATDQVGNVGTATRAVVVESVPAG